MLEKNIQGFSGNLALQCNTMTFILLWCILVHQQAQNLNQRLIIKKKTEPLELLLKSVKILRKSTKLQSFQKENNLTEITHKTKTKVAKYWAIHYSSSVCTKRLISLKIFHTTIRGKSLWQGILAPEYIRTVSCNHRIN